MNDIDRHWETSRDVERHWEMIRFNDTLLTYRMRDRTDYRDATGCSEVTTFYDLPMSETRCP